jgi:subtilisin family serine protease
MSTYHGLDSGDPLYALQPAARYWKLAQLHKSSTGRGVRVAVIDSGVDASHPDLAQQVALQQNFVEQPPAVAEVHGTAVAGIIAARAGNGLGIAGVAPGARLQALRACWTNGAGATRCNSFTLGKALNFAIANGAKVVNLSLSGPEDRLLHTLLDAAAARGMVVVGAADAQRSDGGFPASHPGVIAVAGADGGTAPAGALLAPGAAIPATLPGARWGFVSGPSYAAAHVAGLAALLAQLHPAANAPELRDKIRTVAAASAEPSSTVAQAGTIDACATIARATGACACSCPTIAVTNTSIP